MPALQHIFDLENYENFELAKSMLQASQLHCRQQTVKVKRYRDRYVKYQGYKNFNTQPPTSRESLIAHKKMETARNSHYVIYFENIERILFYDNTERNDFEEDTPCESKT